MFLHKWVMSVTIIMVLTGCVDSASGLGVDDGKLNYRSESVDIPEENTLGNVMKKDINVSIYSYETDSVIKTLSDEEYEENLKDIFEEDWVIAQNVSKNGLEEKAAFIFNQERTKLAGEDKNTPKTYEESVRYIVYNNSPYVGMLIAQDAVKNMHLPSKYRLIFLEIPDDQLAVLKSYIEN